MEDTDDLFLMPLFGAWPDFEKDGVENGAFLATKTSMFGAKRVSALHAGLDLSSLVPACFLVDKGEEAMIFMVFLGPRAKWSLKDLLVLIRHSFRADGEIYQVFLEFERVLSFILLHNIYIDIIITF